MQQADDWPPAAALQAFRVHLIQATSKQSGNTNSVFACTFSSSTPSTTADAAASPAPAPEQPPPADAFLRLTPCSHRSQEEVEAEVEWMLELAAAGLAIGEPLPAADGRYVVPIAVPPPGAGVGAGTPPRFAGVAVLLRAVGGRPLARPADFTPPIIGAWAELLARMHEQAASRPPQSPDPGAAAPGPSSPGAAPLPAVTPASPPGQVHRPSRAMWTEDAVLKTALEDSSPETADFRACLLQELEWMRSLPCSASNFGLTHADLQVANLHVLSDAQGQPSAPAPAPATAGTEERAAADVPQAPAQVAAFDFDDSCYHFFAHDVAVAATQLRKAALEGVAGAAELEEAFLAAYVRARRGGGGGGGAAAMTPQGEAQLREWLPRMVRYRAALIMCWASRERAAGVLFGPASDDWFAKSMHLYRTMITQSATQQL